MDQMLQSQDIACKEYSFKKCKSEIKNHTIEWRELAVANYNAEGEDGMKRSQCLMTIYLRISETH